MAPFGVPIQRTLWEVAGNGGWAVLQSRLPPTHATLLKASPELCGHLPVDDVPLLCRKPAYDDTFYHLYASDVKWRPGCASSIAIALCERAAMRHGLQPLHSGWGVAGTR